MDMCLCMCTDMYAWRDTAGLDKKWLARERGTCAPWVRTGGGDDEKDEKEMGGGGLGGVHPNQSTSLPPALSAEGPTDFCMQTHSRSQLEPSLPRAEQTKTRLRAALTASPIPAASPHSLSYKERAGEKNKKQRR